MKKIILIIFLLPAITVFAQYKNLSFYHLSVENGLPKRTATNAIQDKYGYIWAGTGAGLVRYDGYNTKVYLTELGMGFLSAPSAIYEDHEGELWVGTNYKGLFRYDRIADTFRQCVYLPGGDSAANDILDIKEDGSGNIWAISAAAGQAKYSVICLNKKTGKWQHFSHSDSGNHYIGTTQYYSLLEDHEGKIWVGTENGIYEYDNAGNRFVSYRVSKDSVQQYHGFGFLYQPPSEPDIIWMDFGTKANTISRTAIYFNGLLRFNTRDHTFITYRNIAGDTTGNNAPSIALEDKAGNLWMGTINGLLLFNRQTGTFTNYPTNAKSVNTIGRTYVNCEEDKAGNLWYSSSFSGLFYFNTQNKTFTHYLANTSDPVALQSNLIMGFLMDRTRTLWVSGASEGLQWINKAASIFTVYSNKTGTKNNYSYGSASSYAEDAKNNIWIGTDSGLVYWNRHTDSFKLVKPSRQQFYTDHINCILIDKNGMVWYGTDNGLLCYDPVSGSIKNYFKQGEDGGIYIISCIYEDQEGIMWVGTIGRGLWSLDPRTGKVFHYPTRSFSFTKDNNTVSKQLSSWVVYSIEEDKEGTLWIGTAAGLNRFNRRDSTFTVFIDESKGFSRIRTIREDKNGLLWIGTWEGGFFHFNPEKDTMQQFTEKEGLLFNAVYSCLQDSSGMFWLTSPRGITKFDPATGSVHPITTANGLPAVHIDYGGFRTREGDFLVSTSTGFIEFNPDQITPDPNPPIVHIENIAFTKPQQGNNSSGDSTLIVFGNSKFNLRYNENRVRFSYVGIHYQNAAMTKYAYKLDGYDKNWIQAGTERSVTYTNLSPGTYTFHVKAANSDGVWSKEDSFTIIIHPPWWETWWAYLFYALLFIAFVWGFISYRSGNLKKKNQLLEQKVSQRTNELTRSLENLKSTQQQLIQSEKMASLGELTAGIAHEIQNPLNFVNNFSEVNNELISELVDEVDKGNTEETKAIAKDIKENGEKILHHGKRADAIVKGMLQHSRTSSGQKEPTDINALCDEYLRLAYHGLRAKDKSFNAEMKTDFDETIGKINVVPQDIGRVILNLINNAFYACAERSRSAVNERQKNETAQYVPTVAIVTRKLNDKPDSYRVEIKVADNGKGIPDAVKEKIFQPFFTTKPTGEGTGLGLSLSYDIVKAHGGEIKVESKEGEGTTFIIQIPGY